MGMPGFPFLFCLKKTSFDDNERYVTLSTCTSESTNGRHLLIGRILENNADEKGEPQYEENRQILVLAALLFSFLCFPADKVLAASNVVEVPLTVKQNFEENSNEKGIDLTGTYEFRALDIGIPMPGDSDNDRHVFVLDGNNAEKMISLQFQHGGVYRYHLVQTSKDKENYTYDRSSYIIAVYIKNGENGKLVPQVIAEKNDGKKYGELMFYNSYNKRNI